MGRRPCCDKDTVNKGAWTPTEDRVLANYISLHGHGNWRHLAQSAGLNRCGKSCRLRWMNYLRPEIKRGAFTPEEEDLIIRLHRLLGNRWAMIARRIPGRTDNEIKNYWNSNLAKKIRHQNLWPCYDVFAPRTIEKEQFNTKEGFFLDLLLETYNNNVNHMTSVIINKNDDDDVNNISTSTAGCNEKENGVGNKEEESNNDCVEKSSPFGESEGVMINSSHDVDINNLGVQTKDSFLSELKKVASFLELEDHEWEL